MSFCFTILDISSCQVITEANRESRKFFVGVWRKIATFKRDLVHCYLIRSYFTVGLWSGKGNEFSEHILLTLISLWTTHWPVFFRIAFLVWVYFFPAGIHPQGRWGHPGAHARWLCFWTFIPQDHFYPDMFTRIFLTCKSLLSLCISYFPISVIKYHDKYNL